LKLFINFSFQTLLKNATNSCETEGQIQPDACGSAHIEHVAQQCLHVNCLQLIQKKMEPNSPHLSLLQVSCLGCKKLFKHSS